MTLTQHYDVFEKNIQQMGDCWLWTGGKTSAGYGMMPNYVEGIKMYAHRFSYAFFNDGEVPQVVRHKCDNPACVNPDHLEGGTHADNVRDRIRRGRPHGKQTKPDSFPVGEDVSGSKLTESQVVEIRKKYRPQTVTTRQLASKYGLALSSVKRLIKGEQQRSEVLSDGQVNLLLEEYNAGCGYSTNTLSTEYGVSKSVIKDIISGKAWKHVK